MDKHLPETEHGATSRVSVCYDPNKGKSFVSESSPQTHKEMSVDQACSEHTDAAMGSKVSQKHEALGSSVLDQRVWRKEIHCR